jgi:predicted acyltransferase
MAGMSFMLTAAFTYLIDVNGYKNFKMSQVFGTNSIFTYVLAGILGSIFYSDYIIGIELNTIFVNSLVDSGIYPKVASLLYAIMYVIIIYIPANYLFKKKIFIKL